MSRKEKLAYATSHSKVRSTILSGFPVFWHHQLFKSQWAERKENVVNPLMSSLNMASSFDLLYREDKKHSTFFIFATNTDVNPLGYSLLRCASTWFIAKDNGMEMAGRQEKILNLKTSCFFFFF